MKPKGTQERKNICPPATTWPQPLPWWALRNSGYETGIQPQIAEPRIKGMISVSPHSCIHRKALTFLTWDILFSFINKKTFDTQATCLLQKNFYITQLLPSPSPGGSFRVTWDVVSWIWSPKNFPWIKHNSQYLGCMYFFSQQFLCHITPFECSWMPTNILYKYLLLLNSKALNYPSLSPLPPQNSFKLGKEYLLEWVCSTHYSKSLPFVFGCFLLQNMSTVWDVGLT